MSFEKLKNLYKDIYTASLETRSCIENADLEGVEKSLQKKEALIESIKTLSEKLNLTEKQYQEINDEKKIIKEAEQINIEAMEIRQNALKEKIFGTEKKSKTLSSYKSKKEISPRLLDVKE